jgi:hypothetical protein
MSGFTIDLPITEDDRDDLLQVTFAVWPGDHPGQADTLEIIGAEVNNGDMPGEESIKALVWQWIKAEREAV